MAIGKRLHNIAVTYSLGKVGMTLSYDTGPQDHIIMPVAVATSLRDRLNEALELAAKPAVPGDSVSVSDHVAVKITEH